jgi:predicted RNA-binding protein YlqC (UPF0109 family)
LGAFKTKKLYIPWREHPEINFLGLLIGPKGITQKKFQDTTGAKYQIRGLGAAKDGASNTGHPDDTDELHVVVEGTNDAVDRACKELEKFLYNPAEAAKLKAEQLKQLVEMNNQVSSQNYTVEEVYSGGSAESFTLEILVPNNMVGLIIGKGGDNILRIHSQLGVQSHIAKEADMKPGETMRSIVLKGVQDNVHEAKKRIEEIVSQRVAQLRGNTGNSQQKDEMNHAFIVKLPVLNENMGLLLGKGGSTIKGIQDRTKTIVKIPHGPDEDNPQVRTVFIGGDSKEGVDACQMEIFLTLQRLQQSAQMAYDSIANAMNVIIPDDKAAFIIGEDGCNVKDIQGRLNVKIQIPHGADIGSNPPTRTISLVGSPEMQTLAKYEIELLASGTAPWCAAAFSEDNAAALYAQSLAGSSDPQQQAAAAALMTGSTSATTAETAAAEVPTDPTAYYNDFWYYASFYGEAAARVYYGAWSPEGTKPPEGMVIPADPAATTAAAASIPTATTSSTTETASLVKKIIEFLKQDQHQVFSQDTRDYELLQTATLSSGGKILTIDDDADDFLLLGRFAKELYIPEGNSKLYDYILEKSAERHKIIVIGNPGIGKTSFGLYLMWRLLLSNQIFIYEYAVDNILLLLPGINFRITRRVATNLCTIFSKKIVYIADNQGKPITEPAQLNCKYAVVITSPNPQRFSDFAKNNAWKVFVNIPNEDEIMDMWTKVARFRSVPEETVKEQLRIYGPIPRYIFDEEYHGEEIMNAAIAKNGEKIYELLSSDMQLTMDDNDVSYRLVHLVTRDFRCHDLKVATQYVYDNLSADMKRKVAVRFFTSILHLPAELATASRTMFEVYLNADCLLQKQLQVQPLLNGSCRYGSNSVTAVSNSPTILIPPLTRCETLDSNWRNSLGSLEESVLYCCPSKVTKSLDGFFINGDSIHLLQYTLADHHGVRGDGLQDFTEGIMKIQKKNNMKVHLVFVTAETKDGISIKKIQPLLEVKQLPGGNKSYPINYKGLDKIPASIRRLATNQHFLNMTFISKTAVDRA